MNELVNYLSGRLNIPNKLMIEKDVLLHRILQRLVNERWFKEGFAFKGGTCLTKCYLGYYRFSEDLDFTYINQDELSHSSQKEIRRVFSKKINDIMMLLSGISSDMGLRFNKDKSDDRFIEFGGSNKFVTFKLWYRSDVLKLDQFVKIQINFVEMITEKIIDKKAASLYSKIPKKEMKLLFPEYMDIISEVSLNCYSLKEIFYEKIRAILTRRGLKSRDFIDAFLIMKKEPVDIRRNKEKIISKIRFMLRYDKYIQNLSMFDTVRIVLGDEEKLMLVPIQNGFDKFMKEFSGCLHDISESLKKEKAA